MGQIVKHRVKKNLIRAKESFRFFYISRLFAVYTTLREIRPLTDQIMPVNKYLIIFALFILIRPAALSQDPRFSQFYANPLYLAPSFAGATEENRLVMNYRNQWPAIPGVFLTYSFSYDRAFPSFNSGVGVLVTHDRAGSGRLSNTNIGILYSYDIQINKLLHVRPGIIFKYTQTGLDFWRLVFNDQITPGGTNPGIEQPPFENAADIDFGTSVLGYTDKLWLGVTVDHLLRPNRSLYGEESRVPIKVSVYGGAQIIRKGRLLKPIEESLSLAFNFEAQAQFTQLDFGLYWYKNPLVFGFWYRGLAGFSGGGFDRDALIVLVGYKTKQLHIGYSYDFTISSLLGSTGGSHEVSVMYEFKSNKKRKRKIHAIPCPEF